MLSRFFKGSFGLVGLITGFTLARFFFHFQSFGLAFNELQQDIIYISVSIVFGIAFLSSAGRFMTASGDVLDKMESAFQRMSAYEIIISSFGLVLGLIIANLVTIPIVKVSFIGVPIAIIANVLFGFLGISIAHGKKDEFISDIMKPKKNGASNKAERSQPKILDTSAIIDGRIADVCKTGFIDGELIIPGFILEELRHIADSSDTLKRNRGRRGLDILNIIQKEPEIPVRIEQMTFDESSDVDDKLLKMALRMNAKIVTTDYNLNKVAIFHGVSVLNINELSNAVKPQVLPGEEMSVLLVKDGKENAQGLGYLDDGTMIVVEGGKKLIGEIADVIVTSVLQTAAGRMIFAKIKA